jgi:hypothetical protein
MQARFKMITLSAVLGAATVAGVFVAPRAEARGGRPCGPPVATAGPCSDGTSNFTLKSMFDDTPFPQGTVGAEFQVNSGVIGQTWQVTLTDNGANFFDAPVQTVGPEGGLNVTHPNQGSVIINHVITAKAVNAANGAVCTGTVQVPALPPVNDCVKN